MDDQQLRSLPGVLHVEVLRGREAPRDARPDFLVEVPHGADRRSDYDELRALMVGDLPADLHEFFHVNTDVGAWAVGRATAQRVVAAQPGRVALLLRCLVPRTFVDCNRPPAFEGEQEVGGLTAGVPEYVRDERDRRLLLQRHSAYVAAAERAHAAVCGGGGVALVPHTYGPCTLGIDRVDDGIVEKLRWAHEPGRLETWPPRADVDLLTRDPDGRLLAPEGIEEVLLERFREIGLEPVANETYCLQPPTLAHRWSEAYPGRVTCLEVRRDLLVEEWLWSEEMLPLPAAVDRFAGILAEAVGAVPVMS